MSDLRKGWVWTQLGEIVNIKYGKDLSTKQISSNDKYPVFGANGIIGFYKEYLYEEKQVLISCRGAYSGKINYSPPKCFVTHNSLVLEVNDKFKDIKKYLYYALRSVDKSKLVTGSAQPQVTISNAIYLNLPFPPLNEQHRIVAKLERLLQKVDACKERLDKIPSILKRFRQSVLSAACSGRLTTDWREKHPDVEPASELLERIQKKRRKSKSYNLLDSNLIAGDLPESWVPCQLNSLAELITKGSSPNWQGINYVSKGTLFITSENVGSGHLIFENKKYVEERFNNIQKRSILKKGDLLTNIVGASIGRSAIFYLDEEANINQAVALIRLYNEIDNAYILNILNSPAIIDFMHRTKVDVARANLSLQDVSEFPVPLPPKLEQQEIVRRVEALFKIADRIEERYKKAMTYVDNLTQSILAKAFRGELVPQNPRDEPASVLLERIREERAKKQAQMKVNKKITRKSKGKRKKKE